MVRQDLEREHGIVVSLRTVERAVAPLRRELAAAARATLRFETPPGHQLQVDFGELREIAGMLWQRGTVTDGSGRTYALDYQMVPGPDGWRINGVQLLPAPQVGA